MSESGISLPGSSAAGRADLAQVAESVGDVLYLSGMQMADLGATGPTLEGALSAIALAQTHLGHARQWYRIAHLLRGTPVELSRDALPPAEERCSVPLLRQTPETWMDLICNVFLVNLGAIAVMQALVKQPALALQLRKMLHEQEYSLVYSSGWVNQLAGAAPALASRTRLRLNEGGSQFEEWLRAAAGGAAARDKLLPSAEALVAAFRQLLHQHFVSRSETAG